MVSVVEDSRNDDRCNEGDEDNDGENEHNEYLLSMSVWFRTASLC